MVESIPASEMTLSEVEDQFDIRQVLNDVTFFQEWQSGFPALTEAEAQHLERVKTEFLYLNKYPLLEDLVKMVVLSPLLSLAGFYRPPLRPVLEKRVDVAMREGEKMIWGRIDILLLKGELWVAVVESKQTGFSLKDAIAQTLFYMAGNPDSAAPSYGLVTNGSHFIFIKLVKAVQQYALSTEFSLYRPQNELHQVLQILQRLVNQDIQSTTTTY